MPLQTRVAPSKVVLQNLLICVILFYTVYYAVLGMCCMMLKVYELDVLAPFDFKTYPSWLNTNYKGKALQDNWVDLEECLHPHEQFMRLLYIHGYQLCVPNDYLNMPFYYKDTKELIFKLGNDWYQRNVLTYLVCGLLFVLVVEEWVWDYAISVTILHVVITSTVMLEFPLTSHWWAALGSGLISMIGGGQAFAYCLFKDNFIYPDLEEF